MRGKQSHGGAETRAADADETVAAKARSALPGGIETVPSDYDFSESEAMSEQFQNAAIDDADDYFGDESATLGDRVAAARQSAGLTQAGLAARLGVGAKVVSAWENDRSEPRANRLAMLAGLLNVSVAWLLTGRGEGVDPPEAPAAAAAALRPFLFAFAVEDLDAARRFYGDVLGCRLGASAPDRQDFDLFGHQISACLAPAGSIRPAAATDAEGLPVPHFGVMLEWADWRAAIERLRQEGGEFLIEPTIRFVGAPNEEGLFAVSDPSGAALAFRSHRNADQAFA